VTWPLFQVDPFCAEPFAGNPAAVCLLEADADPGWMQRVAAEMNLSETAFLTASGPLAARPGPGEAIWLDFPATPAEPVDEAAVRGLRPELRRLGRLEDPVTGSAHCTLGPFWAGRLGRDELTGFQASARGGLVQVRPEGDRVQLGGRAVTVLRGQLV
jgi:predicted PhzF superfamily epimerase YddE/YHI9